jgi:hypothetical protein
MIGLSSESGVTLVDVVVVVPGVAANSKSWDNNMECTRNNKKKPLDFYYYWQYFPCSTWLCNK